MTNIMITMKKYLNLWLLAALFCGMSLGVASCKDDDNDDATQNGGSEDSADSDEKEPAEQFWDIVSQLAGASAICDDYQNGNFEPIIGVADEENPQQRIVATNDLETAVMRFNNLINEERVDTNTTQYTWHSDAVGTLTYTKSTDGRSLATVDVAIRQMPKLERIVYQMPQQRGANGQFDGTAYYRFGDVVSIDRGDGHDDVWVCVRPAFGPEGKEDSHWVCLSPLPAKNVWTYTASNKQTYKLPTGLGDPDEHAQNLAEMLFAICFPTQWEYNVKSNPFKSRSNKGVPMFNDFDKDLVAYHSSVFWQRVQDAWRDRGIFQTVFGPDMDLDHMREILTSKDGLNLLVRGLHWNKTSSNSPTLYRYQFAEGAKNESNMHKGGQKNASKEVIKKNHSLDVTEEITWDHPYWIDPYFFGNDARHYVVRYAKGSELATTRRESTKQPLAVSKPGRFSYRYNQTWGITDLSVAPEQLSESTKKPQWGAIAPGTILKDEKGHHWLCYAAWTDSEEIGITKDRKARFISLDGIGVEPGQLRAWGGGNVSANVFTDDALEELMPFAEAPICAVVLALWASTEGEGQTATLSEVRSQIDSAFGISLADFLTVRDSALVVDNVTHNGVLSAINLAYYEGEGAESTNRYLRYVCDESGMSSHRTQLPESLKYPRYRFFTKYTDSDELLDLTHPFKDFGFVTAYKSVPYDGFSHAMHHDTKQRDGSFTIADAYTDVYSPLLYNQDPKKYVTPYREKVIVARYREIYDPAESLGIPTSYDGHTYTVVYRPTGANELLLRTVSAAQRLLAGDRNKSVPNICTMDGETYLFDYYTFSPQWN